MFTSHPLNCVPTASIICPTFSEYLFERIGIADPEVIYLKTKIRNKQMYILLIGMARCVCSMRFRIDIDGIQYNPVPFPASKVCKEEVL